jgi:asparagine synthase (glutamine-hydrolysing)
LDGADVQNVAGGLKSGMSGICAIWQKDASAKVRETASTMCAGLSLTGCEQQNIAVHDGAALGVSARFPSQRLFETPNLVVACDAQLYNQPELHRLLINPAPQGDPAALFAGLYERFGPGAVEKARGDFSVIVYDRRSRTLFAATDPFAVCPLVYYEDVSSIVIASRLDALMASRKVQRDVNPRGIANYLNYTVNLAPETIFAGVQRLLPGTYLLASASGREARSYWDMRYDIDSSSEEEDLCHKLESVVQEAVRLRSTADFSRVGAFLSGGTDSSTIVGMMSRLNRGAAQSFSTGFQEERFNELEYAHLTAKRFGSIHRDYIVSAADCANALPHIVRFYDEPYGNSSAIPTYFCAKLAADNGVEVLLGGDGGDELFGGNERYRTDKIFEVYQNIPKSLRKGLIEPALAAWPSSNGVIEKARRYIRRSNFPQPYRFYSYNPLLEGSPADIFPGDFLRTLGDYSVLEIPSRYYWNGPARDHLNKLLYMDVKITLGDNDLFKVTRMCECAGVQPRFPFLDRAVAELSGSLPPGMKVKRLEKRYLFKRAFRSLLPDEVLRKAKHGWGVPVAYWMKSDKKMRELAHDVLLSPRAHGRGYIRQDYMEDLFRKHETDETPFYGDTIWTFLMLELWFRHYVDTPLRVAV